MAALYEVGYGLYAPFGENTRCDLVIEADGRLHRVQIKTGRLRRGAVEFNTCSSYAHHPNPKVLKRTYEQDVDFFAVYCRGNQGVYLIPIAAIPTARMALLRVEPPRNNQVRHVRWARDYEVGTVTVVTRRGRLA